MDDNPRRQNYGMLHHAFASPSMAMTETTGQQSLGPIGTMDYCNFMSMPHHAPPQQSNAAMPMMSHPHTQPHNPTALPMMLQPPGLGYYNPPVQMFPTALQQAQDAQYQYHASIACSKRFSEEEKQKLEKVFTDESQKPSTSRKKQLAEELGCPNAKVNNWFQNRRAREKQMHKIQEYEASQAAGLAVAENDGADQHGDQDDTASGQAEGTPSGDLALKPSSAPFSDADDASEPEESFQHSSNRPGCDFFQSTASFTSHEISDFSGFDSLSPDMLPETSPVLDQTGLGHSPSTASTTIASRRKTRPPQRLNQTALRSYPSGPKTGIEGAKSSDLYRTMRRAASATGPLSGKIIKSGGPQVCHSPRTLEPVLLEHIARSSSLSASSSALHEPATASPVVSSSEQQYLSADHFQRSSSLSVNTYGEPLSLSPRTLPYKREDSFNGGQTPNFQQFQNPTFTLDNGCGNISPNEPLTTPGLSQFGSEHEFPTAISAPGYVESEPVTPSYVPVNLPAASTAPGQGFSTLKVETPPQGDAYSWSMSPDQFSTWNVGAVGQFGEPPSHNFLFQPNITPQNFNSPGQA